jgi:hypothetical protein
MSIVPFDSRRIAAPPGFVVDSAPIMAPRIEVHHNFVMSAKRKSSLAVSSSLRLFLAGFVPHFLDKRRVRLNWKTRARLSSAQRQIVIDEIRRLADRMPPGRIADEQRPARKPAHQRQDLLSLFIVPSLGLV